METGMSELREQKESLTGLERFGRILAYGAVGFVEVILCIITWFCFDDRLAEAVGHPPLGEISPDIIAMVVILGMLIARPAVPRETLD
jgi:hypothetical protein